jgi:uncharacterized protein YhaN
MPSLTVLKGLWSQSKWVIIIGFLVFTHFTAWNAGAKSELRKQAEQSNKAVVQERAKGVAAVARASSDVKRIQELERTNAELTKKLDEIPDRALCPMSDDELRVLTEIQEGTNR